MLFSFLDFFFCVCQRQSLDQNFLRDSVLERLQDEVPEVVATSLKVLEVSLHQGPLSLTVLSRVFLHFIFLICTH